MGFYHFKDIDSCFLQGQEPSAPEKCCLSIKESVSLSDTEASLCCFLSVPKAGICCFLELRAWGWGGEFLREKGDPPSKGEYSGPRLGPLFAPSERHLCLGTGRGALSKGQESAVAGFLLLFNSYHLHKYTQETF